MRADPSRRVRLDSLAKGARFTLRPEIPGLAAGEVRGVVVGPGIAGGMLVDVERGGRRREQERVEWAPGILVLPEPVS